MKIMQVLNIFAENKSPEFYAEVSENEVLKNILILLLKL